MWTIVVAAVLTAIIAVQFTLDDAEYCNSFSIPFHFVLWAIVVLDILVAIQWSRVIGNANRIVDRPGGWS